MSPVNQVGPDVTEPDTSHGGDGSPPSGGLVTPKADAMVTTTRKPGRPEQLTAKPKMVAALPPSPIDIKTEAPAIASALVRYEEMRAAVERCARIDEASEIQSKAAALQAYARQRDDADLEVWTAEIKLRASVRIGELVRELDTVERARTDLRPTGETQTKEKAIAAAGLSKSAAHRYQELAGPRDAQAQSAGKAAAEKYFAQSRADKKPATMQGLRGAVKDAVHATLGPPPAKPVRPPPPQAPQPNPIGKDFVDWTSAVQTLGEMPADLASIAKRSGVLAGKFLEEAHAALPRLNAWINELAPSVDEPLQHALRLVAPFRAIAELGVTPADCLTALHNPLVEKETAISFDKYWVKVRPWLASFNRIWEARRTS